MSSLGRPASLRYAFMLALAVRLPLALLQRTPFQPDETYQALEPAHHLVFGSGFLTWEWQWNPPVEALGERWAWLGEGRLRSSAWVGFWASLYWLLQALGLDEALIVPAPKALMAVLAAVCDTATFALARRLSLEAGPVAFCLSLTSVFQAHALLRPFANSAETTLTTLAFSVWPSFSSQDRFALAATRRSWQFPLLLAAVTCAIRPTSAILWVVPGASLLWRQARHGGPGRAARLCGDALVIFVLVFALSTAIDTLLFPPPPESTLRLAFPPLTFLTYNVLLPTSLFYGANAGHYYLSQGLPVLLGFSLPWAVPAFGRALAGRLGPAPKQARELAALVVFTVGVYSCGGHKEWRFLHPILPVLHVLTALSLTRPPPASESQTSDSDAKPASQARSASVSHRMSASIFTFLTLAALPSVVYLSVFHGAAQHSSIAYLRSAIPSAAEGGGLGVLMPCHSTPWQSHLHRQDLGPNHAWFLTCPPPKTLGRSSSSSSSSSAQQRHTTEESEFYTDPARFLRMHFPPRPYPSSKSFRSLERFVPSIRRWPSHLVFFGTLLDGPKGEEVRALLEERGYAADLGWAASRTWNGWDWAQDDERRRGGVAVWRLRPRVADELE